MTPLQQIVSEYRKSQDLSLREFAAALSENLNGDGISHASVDNWEKGEHEPSFQFLLTLALRFRDWRGDFAFDCLAALKPGVYPPAGEIGQRILNINE